MNSRPQSRPILSLVSAPVPSPAQPHLRLQARDVPPRTRYTLEQAGVRLTA